MELNMDFASNPGPVVIVFPGTCRDNYKEWGMSPWGPSH